MYSESSTIAAISTSMSEAGIGIVRMSGEESFEIADRIYRGKRNKKLSEQKSHTIHYGYIEEDGETIDEVLVMLMRGPHTFTGEDTVEINCHGGVYVLRRVLEACLRGGARPAQPGEFTKRAFLNGKLDLSQAEAVIDVIQSRNDYALKSSVRQLKGSVKRKVEEIRSKILYHTAFIESALDDPEHISIDGYGQTLERDVEKLLDEIQRLLDSADDGRIMKEGVQTVIVGKPNAGKSSVLNMLLGEERAIVTDIAGTTRDILQEHMNLHGISLNIVDTAGIRKTDDKVEKIGVDRALSQAREADLIIYVVDSSLPLDENDRKIFRFIAGKKSIILLNKSDLARRTGDEEIRQMCREQGMEEPPVLSVSAKEEEGIEELEQAVKEMFYHGDISFNSEVYITNARQKHALESARQSLEKVLESIHMDMPEDFYSIDLMDAYESLGTITGETVGEDLVNEIFSKFCMGK